MLKDALRILKTLSLYFQSNDASICDAVNQIKAATDKLSAMKDNSSKSLEKLLLNEQTFKGVKLTIAVCDKQKFTQMKSQFYQALCDNLKSRFPGTKFMAASKIFDKSTWPADKLELMATRKLHF